MGFPHTFRPKIGEHPQFSARLDIDARVLAGMEHNVRFLETRNTVPADGIGSSRWNARGGIAREAAAASVPFKVLQLGGQRGLILGINTGGVQAIAETKLVIKDERNAGTNALPLLFDGRGGFMFRPGPEVGSGKMLKVMGAAAKLARVMTAVTEIKSMIAPQVEARLNIADPIVVSAWNPVLNPRGGRVFRGTSNQGLEPGK
jgi:hypothetical protein